MAVSINKKQILKIFLWVLILIGFLFLIRTMNLSEIYDCLKSITLPLILLLAGLQFLTQILLNYQWCHIARVMGFKPKFWRMFYLNSKGTLVESITPGAKIGGEVTRGILFKAEFQCSTADSASIVAIQKIISIGSLVLLNLTAFMLLPLSVPFLSPALKIALQTTMFLLLLLLILLLFQPQFLSKKLSVYRFKHKSFQELQTGLIEYSNHAQKIRSAKSLIFELLLSVFIWALFPFKLVLLAGQYQKGINPLAILSATLTAYFISMIPISPGGLGVFEVTLSSLLIMFGLTSEQAFLTAVLFRFFTFWFVILYSVFIILFYDLFQKIKKMISDKKKKEYSDKKEIFQ